jgi:hypothetical protein
MKNDKTLYGIAYMFLGAALLISGATLQDQISRLAADPDVQLAKAMYMSVLNKAVAGAKTQVMAVNTAPAVMEIDSAEVAPVVFKSIDRAAASRQEFRVVVPSPKIDIAALNQLSKGEMFRGLREAELEKLAERLERVNFQAIAAANRATAIQAAANQSSEMRRIVMVRADAAKALKCAKVEVKTVL